MESQSSVRCGVGCLGSLTFCDQIKGDMIHLSNNGRLAQRKGDTSVNGLLFSSRPIRLQERVRLRVMKQSSKWNGALRVGFTNVPPSARHLPLPSMAFPDLTNTPGHWVGPVCDSLCWVGSELEFWVSHGGNVYVSIGEHRRKLLSGLDLSRPLWAVVDLYGQTQAVQLLGSKMKLRLLTRRSCPVPEHVVLPSVDDNEFKSSHDSSFMGTHSQIGSPLITDGELHCVVCMEDQASMTLPCGHRCLCSDCWSEFLQTFDSCPLCRQKIHPVLSRGDTTKS
ncbi:E3 ubiquitin-protein ligase NEURL3-like [Neosynchiropus ocellatus]